jgi:hypothetical protein
MRDVDTIITGHSNKTMTMADLREYADFNKDFVAWVEGEMKAGKGCRPANFRGLKGYIQGIYDELKK